MRLGFERLGGMVRERMSMEPTSRAMFVFVNRRGNTMKVLTYDSTGVVLVHKRLSAALFRLPPATGTEQMYVVLSDAMFDVLFRGEAVTRRKRSSKPKRTLH
jgi:transposase